MDRNGTIEDFSTITLRALKFFQGNILKRSKDTWVPLLVGYPQKKVHEASNSKVRSSITSLDDFYFLNPFADLVTFTLEWQGPAGMNKAFGTEKQRGAQHREYLLVDDQPGIAYDIEGRPMDNLVRFDCWSSTGRNAGNLATRFKIMMEYMKGSIIRQGFRRVEFWERAQDKDVTRWRDDISCVSLRYYVGTEEISITPKTLITQIDWEMRINQNPDEEQEAFLREIAGLSSSGYVITPEANPFVSGMSTGTTELLEHL
jgi:hypothetical protein